MRNFIIFELFAIFILVSCDKDNNIFYNSTEDCLYSFPIPKNDYVSTKSYFIGTIGNDSISIYNGDGDYVFSLNQFVTMKSLPGEWINPADTSKVTGIGIVFQFHNSDHTSIYRIISPVYDKNTTLEKMLDDIGKNENLKIGDAHARLIEDGYSFGWSIKCDPSDDSFLMVRSGYQWLFDYYYDQAGKWIRVNKFEKKKVYNKWVYEIEFDINVNLFYNRGYFAEVIGKYCVYFSIL